MTTPLMEQPLPCAFCDSEKIEEDSGDESACYRCRNCGAQSGRVYFTADERNSYNYSASLKDALEAWNRRDYRQQAAEPAEPGEQMRRFKFWYGNNLLSAPVHQTHEQKMWSAFKAGWENRDAAMGGEEADNP